MAITTTWTILTITKSIHDFNGTAVANRRAAITMRRPTLTPSAVKERTPDRGRDEPALRRGGRTQQGETVGTEGIDAEANGIVPIATDPVRLNPEAVPDRISSIRID